MVDRIFFAARGIASKNATTLSFYRTLPSCVRRGRCIPIPIACRAVFIFINARQGRAGIGWARLGEAGQGNAWEGTHEHRGRYNSGNIS